MFIKKDGGLLVFLVILFFLLVQSASGTFVNSFKNGTTYYNETWDSGHLRGRIDWGVYDNQSAFNADFAGLPVPGDGAYIYAYQIFNDEPFSDVAVAYFAILGLDDNNVSDIGYEDDGSGGTESSDAYVDSSDGAVWEWMSGSGFSLVYQSDHSWLLLLSSDYGPVKRDYEIRGPEDNGLEGPDVPEPSIMALIGLGGTLLYARRKKRAA